MKKRITAMLLMCAMVVSLMSTTAFAAVVDDGETFTGVETEEAVTPRIGPTTITRELKTNEWTLLYSDGNWFNAVAKITNEKGNPGKITVKVEAIDKDGVLRIVDPGFDVEANDIPKKSNVIPSTYVTYYVYAKATTVAGNYTITYSD